MRFTTFNDSGSVYSMMFGAHIGAESGFCYRTQESHIFSTKNLAKIQ
jgi:hypothetical protein